jgi:hypothetical protein
MGMATKAIRVDSGTQAGTPQLLFTSTLYHYRSDTDGHRE